MVRFAEDGTWELFKRFLNSLINIKLKLVEQYIESDDTSWSVNKDIYDITEYYFPKSSTG